MYYFLDKREKLIEQLPAGAVAAEIGVAYGDFAEHMIKTIKPKELNLIDPWSHLEDITAYDPKFLYNLPTSEAYVPVPENAEGKKLYEAVCKRFENNPEVKPMRQFSYKLAAVFPNGYFDFIYVDGNHNYEFVLNDLLMFAPKIKQDGLILGHDFFENDFAVEKQYAIIEAVTTFIKRSDFKLIGLTYEEFSTFVLARNLEGYAAQFIQNCIDSEIQMVELPANIAPAYFDKMVKRSNGSMRRIPSFIFDK